MAETGGQLCLKYVREYFREVVSQKLVLKDEHESSRGCHL